MDEKGWFMWLNNALKKEIFACWIDSSSRIKPEPMEEILFETKKDGYFIGCYDNITNMWSVKRTHEYFENKNVVRWNRLSYAKALSEETRQCQK